MTFIKNLYKKFSIKQVFIVIVLFLIFIFTLKALYNLYYKYAESATDLNKSREDLQALILREAVLSQSIEDLNTDRGKEQEIRNRFDVAKEGESVVIIVDEKATVSLPVIKDKSLFQKIKDIFLLD